MTVLVVVALSGPTAGTVARAENTAYPVFVDALVRQESARRKGDAAYRARTATVQGTPFPSAPNNARPADRRNTLTVELDRSYGRFKAGVGREDDEHLNGPAYCWFELYGEAACCSKAARCAPR